MRKFLSCVILVIVSQFASAETIRTTDGCVYTRAADGNLYPSSHVLPNGSVLPASYSPQVNRTVVPQSYYQPLYQLQPSVQSCPNGNCPNQRNVWWK